MSDSGSRGLQRLIRALGFSWAGLKAAFRHEAAFREEVALSVLLIPLALWLGHGGLERAVLLAAWLLVPIVELLNSGVEAVVDRISDEHHPLAGRAKDLGSAAVLIALINAGAVWALVLWR
ncbi:MAG: diacylglycerol kinase [Gammaproteobacteria bacterium]